MTDDPAKVLQKETRYGEMYLEKMVAQQCQGTPTKLQELVDVVQYTPTENMKDLVPELEWAWPTLACKSGRSMVFWSQEWNRHGTCSDLDQHANFQAALAQAGIVPLDDETYSVSGIRDAIGEATGHRVSIECNRDALGKSQLYQVYQCVDRSGKALIDCELPMRGHCRDAVKFPTF